MWFEEQQTVRIGCSDCKNFSIKHQRQLLIAIATSDEEKEKGALVCTFYPFAHQLQDGNSLPYIFYCCFFILYQGYYNNPVPSIHIFNQGFVVPCDSHLNKHLLF